jgi:hypothetical protein
MLRHGLPRSTGMPLVDAREDFARARRAHLASRWLRRPLRGSTAPRTLHDVETLPRRARRLSVVPLDCIVGTLEPTAMFDAQFRPASDRVRKRWERVALAHRTGAALPPVTLLERPDGMYVVDGRHRVSVARALGLRDIDAYVTRVGAIAPVALLAA